MLWDLFEKYDDSILQLLAGSHPRELDLRGAIEARPPKKVDPTSTTKKGTVRSLYTALGPA
jgi:hypothetical protein